MLPKKHFEHNSYFFKAFIFSGGRETFHRKEVSHGHS